MAPSQVLTKVADGLPGFGIVAAVLGIVITMGSIGGDIVEVGGHVAGALVGTFLGILLGYGFVGPMRSEEHTSELQSQSNLVCRLLLEKKKIDANTLHDSTITLEGNVAINSSISS